MKNLNRKCRNCNYCFNMECDLYQMLCEDAINICEDDNGLMYNENKIDNNFLNGEDWND